MPVTSNEQPGTGDWTLDQDVVARSLIVGGSTCVLLVKNEVQRLFPLELVFFVLKLVQQRPWYPCDDGAMQPRAAVSRFLERGSAAGVSFDPFRPLPAEFVLFFVCLGMLVGVTVVVGGSGGGSGSGAVVVLSPRLGARSGSRRCGSGGPDFAPVPSPGLGPILLGAGPPVPEIPPAKPKGRVGQLAGKNQ